MRITLVVSLLIALLAVIFALSNPDPLDVRFGPFATTGSTALILMLTFVAGVAVGALFMIPRRRKRAKKDTGTTLPPAEPTADTSPLRDITDVPPTPRG